jgi:serine/threonine-protein kinase
LAGKARVSPKQTVGHYRIAAKLGAGGMGVVYKAEDLKLGRFVALKFLPAEFKEAGVARDRFLREAQATSTLDHPNIGVVHGIEETPDGQLFIVMAYYEGETLAERIRRGPLPRREVLAIACQMAEALDEAHRKGIIHRDVKPSNVILTAQGTVKIVDFGLAKVAGAGGLTETGKSVGTAAYMAPEQALGRPTDGRCDIWAWGVVLYEMLTGVPPFAGDSVPSLLFQVVHEPARPMGITPPSLESVVQKAMAKDPAQRYAHMSEAVADLRRMESGESLQTATMAITQTAPQPAPRDERLLRKLTRRRMLAIVCGVMVVALALLAALPATRRMAATLWGGLGAQHIAVLPFHNIGNDPAGAALCDGLMDVLTSQLTAMEQGRSSFWVVPADEVRRRNPADPEAARRDFGVNRVITGSVQRTDTAITLTINVIDAGTGQQIGSDILGDPGGNLFQLQSEAVTSLRKLLAVGTGGNAPQHPVDPLVYSAYLRGLGFAQRYDKAGNLDQGIALLEQAAAADNRFAAAFSRLGEACWRKYLLTLDAQWIQRASEACQRALNIDAQLPSAHVTLGRIREGTGQRDLAVEEYRRVLVLDPRNADAILGLARMDEALGRPAEAEGYFRKAIALRPEYWVVRNGLANFYLRQSRYKEAEAELRKVLDLVPDNAAVYINLGATRFRLEDFAGARAAYHKSIELSPSYMAYANLGTVENAEAHYDAGAEAYQKALALNDKDYRVWGSLARANYWAGHADKARAAYERASQMAEAQIRIQPSDGRAYSLLAYYSIRLEHPDAAREQIQHALALAPDDADVVFQAAEVYESLGAREEAVQWALRYLKLGRDPKHVQRSPELRKLAEDPRFRAK